MNEKITDLNFEQIKVGMKKEFNVKITEIMLKNFSDFTGDNNPLHTDENYANTTKFGKRVCHGMLLSSFFSRLIGMELPGKYALYFSQSLNFKLPGFIGDEITVQGEIIEKRNSVKMVKIKNTIYNQEKECLVVGIAKIILRE